MNQEVSNADATREKRRKDLEQAIAAAREDREKWVAQTKKYRQQCDTVQQKLKELESLANATADAAAASKAAKEEQSAKKSKDKTKDKTEINTFP